jgi:hypothetical protein
MMKTFQHSFSTQVLQSGIDRLLSESEAFQGGSSMVLCVKRCANGELIIEREAGTHSNDIVQSFVVKQKKMDKCLADLRHIQRDLTEQGNPSGLVSLSVRYFRGEAGNEYDYMCVTTEDQFNDISTQSQATVPKTINVQEPREDDSEVTHDHTRSDIPQPGTRIDGDDEPEAPTETTPLQNHQSLRPASSVIRGQSSPMLSALNEGFPINVSSATRQGVGGAPAGTLSRGAAMQSLELDDTTLSPSIHDGAGIHATKPDGGTSDLLVPLLQPGGLPHHQRMHVAANRRRPARVMKPLVWFALGTFVTAILYRYHAAMSAVARPSHHRGEPIGRRTQVVDCARIISDGRGLSENDANHTAQWKAVSWLSEGAGLNVEIPSPCTWGTSFGSLYALMVVRETLSVLDRSWYGKEPLNSFSQACRWKRVTCDADKTSVKRLILNHAGLHGTIPLELAGLQELATLQIENNNISGTIPSELGEMSRLEYVFLQENDLTGTIPTALGRLTALRQLVLDKTDLAGSMPSEICKLRKVYLNSLNADCRTLLGPAAVECDCPSCCTSCSY